ncbi:hypothetical protein HIM_11649 [Hirsutella minnesotensis 3608]|uniref:Reverse transcriptase domain-containing protein n=1 Tax=Hirsutella minnesotensis 3608 TaxID=1043627 RepID=A0A0F7ZWG9_9HYPO|nr:hypothetical protein HIM_11649 [Hirsutella minnesotensis 3608]
MATPEKTPVPEIFSAYREWADVFSEEEAARLPPLSGRSHPIDLEDGQIPPAGPIYNLSEHELLVLREYIASAQKKGWIRRSISPAGAPILFVPKKGGKLAVVMPFGLVNAPASFQQYINDALEGLVDIICVVYLDDILIFSEDPEQHEDHVKEVLQRLRKAKLYANLSKCEFSVKKVSFLGFLVDEEGIHMEKERVDAIAEWPAPRSVKEIQTFLGFTGFYRRFIKNYSKIASPLTDCLRKRAKGPLILGRKALQAFEELKKAFQDGPILRHFDPCRPIRIETDASQFAIGAIISQLHADRWHPVAFLLKYR